MMRILLCDRGGVLAEFQRRLRDAAPDLELEVETDPVRAVEAAGRSDLSAIVTEIDLDGLGGAELVSRFRRAAPEVPVICWSGDHASDIVLAVLGAGATGFLLKSEEPATIAQAVRTVAAGAGTISADVAHQLAEHASAARLHELEMEDVLARASSEVEKMTTSKAEFLANISHELRTPATIAKSIGQVLATREVDEATRTEFLGQLQESLDKLMGIVEGILTIAESDRGQLELHLDATDLVPLLETAVSTVRARYPAITVEPTFPRELVAVADQERIADVIAHLLDNACRYSPEGGTVDVRGRTMAEGVVVIITDRGEGMQRQVLSRAFDEPFSTGEATLRKERAGAGLGLHLARKLIVEHGGVIWADPLPSGGTRVSFCLPEHAGIAVPASVANGSSSTPAAPVGSADVHGDASRNLGAD
jgi:signal transduction histidine kinase